MEYERELFWRRYRRTRKEEKLGGVEQRRFFGHGTYENLGRIFLLMAERKKLARLEIARRMEERRRRRQLRAEKRRKRRFSILLRRNRRIGDSREVVDKAYDSENK